MSLVEKLYCFKCSSLDENCKHYEYQAFLNIDIKDAVKELFEYVNRSKGGAKSLGEKYEVATNILENVENKIKEVFGEELCR